MFCSLLARYLFFINVLFVGALDGAVHSHSKVTCLCMCINVLYLSDLLQEP